MEYDNRNKGVLFKNEEKEQDNHADYRGSINIQGKEFWLNAWIRTSKKGNKFMSLSVKEKMAQDHRGGTRNPPARTAPPARDEFDDNIPW